MNSLSDHLLIQIALLLPPRDKVAFRRACRQVNGALLTDFICGWEFSVKWKNGQPNPLKRMAESPVLLEYYNPPPNSRLYHSAAERNNIESFEWMDDKWSDFKLHAIFKQAASCGALRSMQWIKERQADLNFRYAYVCAALNGHLEVLKWMESEFGIERAILLISENFIFDLHIPLVKVIRRGHFHIEAWVKEVCIVKRDIISSALFEAASDNNHAVVENLSKRSASKETYFNDLLCASQRAFSRSHIKLANWIFDEYDLLPHKKIVLDLLVIHFRGFAWCNELDSLKWLHNKFDLIREDLFPTIGLSEHGRLQWKYNRENPWSKDPDILKWLWDTYEIGWK